MHRQYSSSNYLPLCSSNYRIIEVSMSPSSVRIIMLSIILMDMSLAALKKNLHRTITASVPIRTHAASSWINCVVVKTDLFVALLKSHTSTFSTSAYFCLFSDKQKSPLLLRHSRPTSLEGCLTNCFFF